MIRVGQYINVTAMHTDETDYRWWKSEIEYKSLTCIVTRNKIGDITFEPSGNWIMKFDSRAYYWANRDHNLLEIYDELGDAMQIYMNIASPFQLETMQLRYFDYELDVNKRKGHPTEILDEDEFILAIDKYGYSDTFIRQCRKALTSAIELAEHWEWRNNFRELKEGI
jgi:protein associated with RNAse G/E